MISVIVVLILFTVILYTYESVKGIFKCIKRLKPKQYQIDKNYDIIERPESNCIDMNIFFSKNYGDILRKTDN